MRHVLLINWSLFWDLLSGHPNFGHQVGRFRWVQDMSGRALHSCGPCQDGLSFSEVIPSGFGRKSFERERKVQGSSKNI